MSPSCFNYHLINHDKIAHNLCHAGLTSSSFIAERLPAPVKLSLCESRLAGMGTEGDVLSGVKLSSVVPSRVTGEDEVRELSNMDLAVKLHNIKGVYFFGREAVEGLRIYDLKAPMFPLLDLYFTVSGRIRKSESGRYVIKCNDGGVRIVEAKCDQTMEEWLALAAHDSELYRVLVYSQHLGPDLGFSPLVFVQFTWFKCGGMSVGLSWAHVLGDAFSAAAFINSWGQIMAGRCPSMPLRAQNPEQLTSPPPSLAQVPSSVKRVDLIGESWIAPNECKLEMHSLHLTGAEVDRMASIVCNRNQKLKSSYFEVLSAIIWKCLSKIREDSGPTAVTICSSNSPNRENEQPRNGMILSTVEADFTISKSDEADLAKVIVEKKMAENERINEVVEREGSNLIVYGAKLTFINLEEADIYGLELKGEKPIMASYFIEGVGDEGAVLVLPNPGNGGGEEDQRGRTVTLILPKNQLLGLRNELAQKWCIA